MLLQTAAQCVTVKQVDRWKPWRRRWHLPQAERSAAAAAESSAHAAAAMAWCGRVPYSQEPAPARSASRRTLLAGGLGLLAAWAAAAAAAGGPAAVAAAAANGDGGVLEEAVQRAVEAWEAGLDPRNPGRMADLERAGKLWDAVVAMEPQRDEWLEARGQLLVDAKRFQEAMANFSEVLRRNPRNFHALSSRALAHEGLAEWEAAVEDYTRALELGREATGLLDPYVRNSRGNALASLGRYAEALRDYAGSAQGFQAGKELDGAIYAAANAALTRIQIGEEVRGMRELSAVARRAPASIDMRAALAALYWAQGRNQLAEEEWEFACDQINAGRLYDGCALYKDADWLRRIRRWPPIMVQRMEDFLHLRSSSSTASSS